jgi:hypothetical protein
MRKNIIFLLFPLISLSQTQIGQDINGEVAGDWSSSGLSISSDGNIVAIGSVGSNNFTGHVKVYQNVSGIWTQIGQKINGQILGEECYQISLSSNGNIIALGSPSSDQIFQNSGLVRIYQNISGVWTQIGQNIIGEALNDYSGAGLSLSSDGNIVAIGAYGNDGNGSDSGHVRVYQNISGVWTQIGQDINGEAAGDKSSGVSLSNNGNIVAIGSNYNDGNGSDSGHVRVFDLSAILTSDNFILESFIIYPNPVSSILNITLKNNLELKNVNIYNSLGQLIKTENKTEINISSLSKGNYFVELITNQGKATRTIIID